MKRTTGFDIEDTSSVRCRASKPGYWASLPGTDKLSCFGAIERLYPSRVTGKLPNCERDPLNRTYTSEWLESPVIDAPSIFHVRTWLDGGSLVLCLDPLGGKVSRPVGAGRCLQIWPLSGVGRRQLLAKQHQGH